jgi:hypothetical protein
MLFLFSGCLAFWALLAYPAYRLGTVWTLADSAIAAALCLLPAALTLTLSYFTFQGKPQDQLWIVLGGTGIRMGTVLGLGLLLSWVDPHFQQVGFWAWVLVFYLFTLGLEVGLLMWGKRAVVAR